MGLFGCVGVVVWDAVIWGCCVRLFGSGGVVVWDVVIWGCCVGLLECCGVGCCHFGDVV